MKRQGWRKLVKIFHSLAAAGLMGGVAAYMLAIGFTDDSEAGQIALRLILADVAQWLIVPSMGLAIFSGFMSMMVHHPFLDTGWVLIKAVTGIVLLEATFLTLAGPAKRAAETAREVASGEVPAQALAELHDPWLAWWVILAIGLLNIVLGIWRPRVLPRRD